jgi:hypothetical protein
MYEWEITYRSGAGDTVEADNWRIDAEDYILAVGEDLVWAAPRENVFSLKRANAIATTTTGTAS